MSVKTRITHRFHQIKCMALKLFSKTEFSEILNQEIMEGKVVQVIELIYVVL